MPCRTWVSEDILESNGSRALLSKYLKKRRVFVELILYRNALETKYLTISGWNTIHVGYQVHIDRDESDEMYAKCLKCKTDLPYIRANQKVNVPLGFIDFSSKLLVLNLALIRANRSSSSSFV